MLAFAITLMAIVGFSLGLLGVGGSIVTLPVLVYVARIPGHQAVGMSLVIVGATSALGSLLNLRRGAVDLRAGALFALSGIPGAFLGATSTHLVSARALLLCFGAMMLVIGIKMLLDNRSIPANRQRQPLVCLAIGLAVGVVTGFLGVGGGIIVLPALVLFAGLEMKAAIGTSLAIIAVNCFAGLLGQLRYVDFDLPLTLAFMAAAAAGMLGGLALVNRVSSEALRRAFGWSIIALGAFVLCKHAFR